MKNNSIFFKIVVMLILFIPTYLAVYNISLITSDKLTASNVTKVVVTASNSSVAPYEFSDKNDITIYIQTVENATEIDTPIRELESEAPFIVSFYKGKKQVDYKLYLSLSNEDCLLISPEDKLCLLKNIDATKLLNTALSDPLYENNKVPFVQIMQGDTMVDAYPDDSSIWYLRKNDNSITESTIPNILKNSNDIRVSRDQPLELEFQVQPDLVNITVYDEKEIIYEGWYETFSEFDYDINKNLRYVITAEWQENEYIYYHGKAVYNFNVEYNVPPVFNISKIEADPGEIITVTALNIRDEDNLSLSADTGYETNFIKTGDSRVAILPVGIDSAGNAIGVSIAGTLTDNAEYQVQINSKNYTSKNLSTSDESYKANKSPDALARKQQAYNEIFSQSSMNTRYWTGKFITPHEGSIVLNYGWTITVNMGALYRNNGVNIDADSGDPVSAINAGKVVYVGNIPDDGNLIVIDHGYGVRSWYGHLDGDIPVKVGDEVTAGQEIAKAGKTGTWTTLYENVYFAVSINEVFVNPMLVVNQGILLEE